MQISPSLIRHTFGSGGEAASVRIQAVRTATGTLAVHQCHKTFVVARQAETAALACFWKQAPQ